MDYQLFMKVKVTCMSCHKDYYLEMTEGQYKRLTESKELIGNIFPGYTPSQRELLISQTCESCWDKIFKSDEYEES